MGSKHFSFRRMTLRRLPDAEILCLLESEEGEVVEGCCTDNKEDWETLSISNSEDSDDEYCPPDENELSFDDVLSLWLVQASQSRSVKNSC